MKEIIFCKNTEHEARPATMVAFVNDHPEGTPVCDVCASGMCLLDGLEMTSLWMIPISDWNELLDEDEVDDEAD